MLAHLVRDSTRPLVLHTQDRILGNGNTHTWSSQCGCRYSFFDTADCRTNLPSGHRPLRIQIDPLSAEVCLKISRTRSNSSGRLSPGLGQVEELNTPPVTLLLRVIAKIRDDKASALLIAPNWPNQPWYPQLGQMLVDYPLLLPKSRFLLYLPFDPQVHHPLWASLHLTVWPVSGDGLKQQAFRQMSFRSCSHRGENQPRRGMQDLGELGQSGAQFVDGVPFQHL